jgi:hypothetical protein
MASSLTSCHFADCEDSGLWIVFPGYNIYVLGAEIVASLDNGTIRRRAGRPKSS